MSMYAYEKYVYVYVIGGKMLISEKADFWSGRIIQSRSEGNLTDMEDQKFFKKCNNTGT